MPSNMKTPPTCTLCAARQSIDSILLELRLGSLLARCSQELPTHCSYAGIYAIHCTDLSTWCQILLFFLKKAGDHFSSSSQTYCVLFFHLFSLILKRILLTDSSAGQSCAFSNGRQDRTEKSINLLCIHISVEDKSSHTYLAIPTNMHALHRPYIWCLYRHTYIHRHLCISINMHSCIIYAVGNARVHTNFYNETLCPHNIKAPSL